MGVVDINTLNIDQLKALYLKERNHNFAKIAELEKKNMKLEKDLEDIQVNTNDLKLKYDVLKAQYNLLVSAKYQSQRNQVIIDQPTLFDDVEEEALKIEEIENTEVITIGEYTKRKHVPKEKHIDYSHLERREAAPIILKDEDYICDKCGGKMQIKKYEEREELVIIKPEVYIRVTRIPVLECVQCQENNEEGKSSYKLAPHPNKLFPHSLVSYELLAYIIDQKYNLGLPLYTIEKMFSSYGVEIPRANMSNWIIASMVYLEPLYHLMKKDLLQRKVIMADETPTQVLREDGKLATSTSYMFVYRNYREEGEAIILYDYQDSRKGDNAKEFLEGFHGFLETDAYSGYNKVEGVTRCMCNIHALRKFKDAYKLLPNNKARQTSDEAIAIKKYQEIFDLENKIKVQADASHLTGEKRIEYISAQRQKQIKKKFDEFLVWLEERAEHYQNRYKMYEAINYVLNNRDALTEFIKHGDVPISNQATEQAIRPFVVIRNRCKFYVSPKGATVSAMIYSLVITAIENRIHPYLYFTYILEKLSNMDLGNEEELRKLLPYSKELPEHTKILSKSEIEKILKQNDMKV